jgi:hypothetical protein
MKKLVAMGFLGMMLSTGAFALPDTPPGPPAGSKCTWGEGAETYGESRLHRDHGWICHYPASQILMERVRFLETVLGVESPVVHIENSDSEQREEPRFADPGYAAEFDQLAR